MTNVAKPPFSEPKCDTCGTEVASYDELFTYALPGLPISVSNCARCWGQDLYPVWAIVGETAAIGGWDHGNEWWHDVVMRSLPVLGLTFEEFQDKVAQVIKEFDDAGGMM